ncbi:hypothetical protein Y032_0003g1483 [Ancylostoma ceylanicum]|nr:hypothetical protein Y032_0003g1483 [Ancylostoma ceylanicum]
MHHLHHLPYRIGHNERRGHGKKSDKNLDSFRFVDMLRDRLEMAKEAREERRKARAATREYIEQDAEPLDSWLSTFVDTMMLLGLMLSTDSIWVFPLETLKNGGFFFLIIYFFTSFYVVVPLLHLEIFVSQICQSGIVKAMQLHGVAFAGVGFGIVVLTVLRHHVGLHRGYYYLAHIFRLFENAEAVVSCESKYVKNKTTCVSIFADRLCRHFNYGRFYINGTCMPDASFLDSVITASDSYAEYLLNLGEGNMDLTIVVIQLCVLLFLSTLGLRVLRFLIAFIYVVTMLFYGTAVFNFPYRKTHEVVQLVLAYSNPKVFFDVETYASALRLSISSAGLCVCGLFCASSFRKRNGNSYFIAWLAFWCNYISCFMSVFATVVVVALMREGSPGSLLSFSVNKQGLEFSGATIPEFFSSTHNVFTYVLILYFGGSYMINWSYSFAVFFVFHSLLRDHLSSRSYVFNTLVLIAYCSASCLYYMFCTWRLAHGIHSVEEGAVKFSTNLYICLMVFVFVHNYGIRELEIDMVSLLGEYEGWFSWINVTKTLSGYGYSMFILMVLQIIDSHRISSWMQFSWWFEKTPIVESKYSETNYISTLIIVTPALIPFLYFLHKAMELKRFEKFSKLFAIRPEHPSFIRLNPRAVLRPGEAIPAYEFTEERTLY